MANPVGTLPPASALQRAHRIAFLVFLFAFGAAFILIASGISSPLYYPLLITLLLSTFATSLLSLAQSLPGQNVLAIACLIALLSGVIEIINLKTHFPFGHRVWTPSFGPQLFHSLPWPVPLIYTVVLLNSRGAARTLLKFRRNLPRFGLWALVLSSVFAALLDFAFERFVATTDLSVWPDSQPVPWYNLFSYGLVFGALLVLITPWLIVKKPLAQSPPDYQSLVVWFLLLLLLLA